MEYEPKYTVVLRGREFVLTKSQIEFDSPNYFTACFLGDFREAQTKRLELSRNPDLFKFIIEHLCGYDIFPLDDKAFPSHMPLDTVLHNLKADALFYQLDELANACGQIIESRGAPSSKRKFLVIGYTTSTRILSDTNPNNISVSRLQFRTTRLKPNEIWTTNVTEEMLSRMGPLQLPESHTDFQGLKTIASIEAFTRKAVGDYRKLGWTLMGWHVEVVNPHNTPDSTKGELLVVLK